MTARSASAREASSSPRADGDQAFGERMQELGEAILKTVGVPQAQNAQPRFRLRRMRKNSRIGTKGLWWPMRRANPVIDRLRISMGSIFPLSDRFLAERGHRSIANGEDRSPLGFDSRSALFSRDRTIAI